MRTRMGIGINSLLAIQIVYAAAEPITKLHGVQKNGTPAGKVRKLP